MLKMSIVAMLAGCCCQPKVIGDCSSGASIYNVDHALWKTRLCSVDGESDNGICMQRGHVPVCMPICHEYGPNLCDGGVQAQTYNDVCYCPVVVP